jgi:cysteine synthase A
LWGVLRLAGRMRRRGESGAIATLIYDGGDAYEDSFYDENWLGQGEEPNPASHTETIERFLATGMWTMP